MQNLQSLKPLNSFNRGRASVAAVVTPIEDDASAVLFLKFDNNVTDHKGIHTPTANGTPTYEAAKENEGIVLNGSSQYVSVPDHANLDGMAAFTVMFWFKPGTGWGTGFRMIFSKDRFSAYDIYSDGGTTPKITAYINATFEDCAFSALTIGTTYHLAVTYDGSIIRTYVNGAATGNTNAASGNVGTNTKQLAIGRFSDAAADFLPGTLDRLGFFSRALSAGEIAAEYNEHVA